MADDWNKIEKKEGSIWDYKEKPEMVGVYKGVEFNVGPNKSTLFKFDDGSQEIAVWGSTALTDKIIGIPVGDEVKIVYKGLVDNKNKTRQYHDFEVFHRSLHDEL